LETLFAARHHPLPDSVGKSRPKTERQNATKGGNEFAAIYRFNLPLFATFYR